MTAAGSSFQSVIVEREATVAIVTISRPKVLNALNFGTLDELRQAMLALRGDETVRAIVLTGAGDKAFAAGADINELAPQPAAAMRAHALRGQHLFDLIENLGTPVIAAINGYALGGGCELAMSCTLRIAAEGARLGQPEINLGLIPGYGGSQRLTRLVGKGRALEMLLTGDHISSADALRIGLVNRVVPASSLMTEARALASALAAKAPLAARYILEAVNRGADEPLREAQALEAALFGLAASTDDMREGTAAFLQKRQPAFKGK